MFRHAGANPSTYVFLLVIPATNRCSCTHGSPSRETKPHRSVMLTEQWDTGSPSNSLFPSAAYHSNKRRLVFAFSSCVWEVTQNNFGSHPSSFVAQLVIINWGCTIGHGLIYIWEQFHDKVDDVTTVIMKLSHHSEAQARTHTHKENSTSDDITKADCKVGDNVPDIWMHFFQAQSCRYIYTVLEQPYAAALSLRPGLSVNLLPLLK